MKKINCLKECKLSQMEYRPKTVVLIDNGSEYEIERKKLIILEKYIINYIDCQKIDLGFKNKNEFLIFCQFLDKGTLPLDEKSIKALINNLKEWNCHESVLHSLILKKNSHQYNEIISRNGIIYNINKENMALISRLYRQHINLNSQFTFEIHDTYTDKAFSAFLGIVHGENCFPEIGERYEVLKLSKMWDCPTLCSILDDLSINSTISVLLNESNLEWASIESYISFLSDNINECLEIQMFGKIDYPILIRIFQSSNKTVSLSGFPIFMKNAFETHGAVACNFIPLINVESQIRDDQLKPIFDTIPNLFEANFFRLIGTTMNSMNKALIEQYKTIIEQKEESEKRRIYYESIINKLKKENAELQKKNNEKESILNEKNKIEKDYKLIISNFCSVIMDPKLYEYKGNRDCPPIQQMIYVLENTFGSSNIKLIRGSSYSGYNSYYGSVFRYYQDLLNKKN